jgi:tetratricopeptide (TPR) repeat protein
LLSAGDGRVLAAVRETAGDAAGLLHALDQLSGKLRERIGESLVTIRANPSLEQVTTGSLAALRKYSEGNRLVDLDRPEEAISVLEEAIALDSGFAMAYRKLAVATENAEAGRSRTIAATMHAYRRRDRLPEIERELATAYYHSAVEIDPVREAAAYRAVLGRDPENGTALNNLAQLMTLERRYPEAESLAVRAQRTGNAASFFFHGLNAQVLQGRLDDARASVERGLRALPVDAPAHLDLVGLLALAARDLATAERVYRQLRQAQRGSADWQRRTGDALARIAETRGRLDEAGRYYRENMATGETRRPPQEYIANAAQLALLDLRYRGRPSAALAELQAALARFSLEGLAPEDRPYLAVAELYATADRRELARRTLQAYEAAVPAGVRGGDRRAGLVYGRVLEAEGKLGEAAQAYRQAHERMGFCGACGLFELAGLYDRQGQPDSARVLLERLVATPSIMGRLFAEPAALAPSYKRLGELYEAKGDRKKAADYYGRFVELWKDADPELQSGVREVRQRLARLAQEPGA